MTNETQNENTQQNQQKKLPLTPESLKKKALNKIKEAKIQDVTKQIDVKYQELKKANEVVAGIERAIEQIIEDNSEIFE